MHPAVQALRPACWSSESCKMLLFISDNCDVLSLCELEPLGRGAAQRPQLDYRLPCVSGDLNGPSMALQSITDKYFRQNTGVLSTRNFWVQFERKGLRASCLLELSILCVLRAAPCGPQGCAIKSFLQGACRVLREYCYDEYSIPNILSNPTDVCTALNLGY